MKCTSLCHRNKSGNMEYVLCLLWWRTVTHLVVYVPNFCTLVSRRCGGLWACHTGQFVKEVPLTTWMISIFFYYHVTAGMGNYIKWHTMLERTGQGFSRIRVISYWLVSQSSGNAEHGSPDTLDDVDVTNIPVTWLYGMSGLLLSARFGFLYKEDHWNSFKLGVTRGSL